MRKLRESVLSVFLLFLIFSCQKEEVVDDASPAGKYTYVFSGLCSSESKITIGEKSDGRWPLLWEKGDELGVYTSAGVFVGSASIDDAQAGQNSADFVISSNVQLTKGQTLHFIYPYNADITFSGGRFTTSVPAAYASAVYNGSDTGFVLTHVNAYMKFSFTAGEFAGYSFNGITLWCEGQNVSGRISLDVSDGTVDVLEAADNVTETSAQPVVLGKGKTYSLSLPVLPGDFTGKKLYAIVNMSGERETVTLPVLLNGAGKLPSHSMTAVTLPALSRSLAPSWYEPVEKRYIADGGKGWAYGPQNTVLFTESEVARTVEFKARGNFMKVTRPAYIQVAYAADLSASKKSGSVYIGGEDAYSGAYKAFALDAGCSASISMKAYYENKNAGVTGIGHMSGLYVLDAQKNVIWGTNLWLVLHPVTTTAFANGSVLDRNIGADVSPADVAHWVSNGCYFQWGRPWAFPWTAEITNVSKALVDDTNTLEKSAANPYTFFYHGGEPFDWYYGDGSSKDRTDDMDDRWGNPGGTVSSGVKSIYDPCPEGYMVVSPSVLAEVENNLVSKVVTSSTPNYILHNGTAWSFAGGYWGSASNGNLSRAGNSNTIYLAAYWSNANKGPDGRMLSYQPGGNPEILTSRAKTAALPVRCMVEQWNAGGGSSGGDIPDGGTGGDIDDDEDPVVPGIPEDFEEEADDPAADPVQTFDYSVLAKAGHPRLLADVEGFEQLKKKVTTDWRQNLTLYKLHSEVLKRADKIVSEGKAFTKATDHYIIVDNLLSCSYAYKMSGDAKYLTKIKSDVAKVCSFGQWEPYGLSIGEISLALGLTYDWLYYDLTLEERKMIHKALVDKGIRPMYNNNNNVNIIGNWNQINLGGVSVASMAVYEKDKDIAVKQMEKAVKGNYKGVSGIYKPDGNYAEGLGYWEYGGNFQSCYLSCLEGIFGHTGGIMEIPGFLDSGEYAMFMHGTMNTTFTYNDGGGTTDPVLLTSWWYAAQKDDPTLIYCEKRRLEDSFDPSYKNTSINTSELPYRMLALMVVMIRDFDMESRPVNPPTRQLWSGKGEKPVVMVRRGWNFNDTDVFLGIVGGLADTWETSRTTHGHMDAGSFVFEAEGVRWSDDIMRPGYGAWNEALRAKENPRIYNAQEGVMWDTFHVSNLCHSTIVSYTNDGSVKGKLHSSDYYVDGYASIDETIDADGRQGAVVDMSAPMKGQVKKALRRVELVNGTDLVVTDEITALDSQDCSLEWRMLSISSASASDSGVILTKNSKKRTLTAVSDNGSVNLTYRTWPTTKPTTDGWGVLDFHQTISNRTIAGWSATVPAGKTVKFVTTLKK